MLTLQSITTATFCFTIQTFLVNCSMPKIFQWGHRLSNLIPNYKKVFLLPTTISMFNKFDTRVWLENTNVCWEMKHKKALKAFVSMSCLPAEFKMTFRLLQFVPLGKIQIGFGAELAQLISSQTFLMVAYFGLQPWLDIRKNPIACLFFQPFFHAQGNGIHHNAWPSTDWHRHNSTASMLVGSSNVGVQQ